MHPSIKLATIIKVVIFFSRKLTTSTNNTVNIFLELSRLGMISTLIYFDREYYQYHGNEKEEKGLAIGIY